MIDIGAMYQGYQADASRTFVLGQPNDDQKKVWDVIRRAYHAAFERIRPGVPCLELHQAAVKVIEGAGYKLVHRIGHGIGLSYCQRVIEHHGGKVWVESEFGKGSTFHFTLPTDRSDHGPNESEQARPPVFTVECKAVSRNTRPILNRDQVSRQIQRYKSYDFGALKATCSLDASSCESVVIKSLLPSPLSPSKKRSLFGVGVLVRTKSTERLRYSVEVNVFMK